MIDTARIRYHPRSLIKAALQRLGYQVSVKRSIGLISLEVSRDSRASGAVPPLLDDPMEAVHRLRGGKSAAFRCPIDQCVTVNGLNFSSGGWHPFSASLSELASRQPRYEGSTLERFYSCWQPTDAHAAFLVPGVAPDAFKMLPPHLIYHFPWSARAVDETSAAVIKWTQDDHMEHDGPEVAGMQAALKDQGPMDQALAEFEYDRLVRLFRVLEAEGFQRHHGDVRVVLIKRGSDFRFLNFGGGLHRTAAMRALGHSFIPAAPLGNLIIDVEDVDYWPQVRNGVWPRQNALRYIDHLFDFDAAAWAQSRLPPQSRHPCGTDISGSYFSKTAPTA